MFLRLPKNPISKLLVLPFDKPPLKLNDRLHRMEHARRVSTIREATVWTARAARLPKDLPHVWVEFVYRAPDRRSRDSDNLVATLKPVADALAAGARISFDCQRDDDGLDVAARTLARVGAGGGAAVKHYGGARGLAAGGRFAFVKIGQTLLNIGCA
mgnify:CR=1 FL=1